MCILTRRHTTIPYITHTHTHTHTKIPYSITIHPHCTGASPLRLAWRSVRIRILDRVDRVAVDGAAHVRAALGLGHLLAEVLALDGAQPLLRLVGVGVAL